MEQDLVVLNIGHCQGDRLKSHLSHCGMLPQALTLGLELQSIISRALDENNHVLMASLDLSTAFNVVNTAMLMHIMSELVKTS